MPTPQPSTTDQPGRPSNLLTQNREMKAIGAWNWSIPAWAGKLPSGQNYNTCPSAGVCRQACYALSGTYRFPVVKAKHQANLAFVLEDLDGWREAMIAELGARRFQGGTYVRVHDAGDFFSDAYTNAWLDVMRSRPEVTFYCYTKEVDRFRRLVEPDPPLNFMWVFSFGGTQDASLDPDNDRVADVFPDEDSMAATGYSSQEASDLLAVFGPRLVGVPANNIPQFLKRMAGRRFSEWQAQVDSERRARGRAPRPTAVAPETEVRIPQPRTPLEP